jgi:hypothetical protein
MQLRLQNEKQLILDLMKEQMELHGDVNVLHSPTMATR